jgi:PEP-CTERM/exosortase A-associated glycosyltransferase
MRLGVEPVVLSSPFQRPASPDCAHGIERIDDIPYYRCFKDGGYGEFMSARKPLSTRARKLLELLPFAARIRQVARRERVQVVHAHNQFFCGLAAALAASSLRLPCIYEVRSLTEDCLAEQGVLGVHGLGYRGYRAFDALTFQLVSHVVTISNGLRDDLVQRGVPPGRITVVGNGVDVDRHTSRQTGDTELRDRLQLPPRAFVLGYIGTLFSYESLDLLLDAMVALRDRMPEAYLLLVGDGDDAVRLKTLMKQRALDDRVRFVGRVPHEQVDRYYELIDLFVLPRRRNRLTNLVTPLKPLEIMARSKAVLASNCGGHLELIEDGLNGYVFDVERPAALAERIAELSRDPSELTELGRRARAWVATHRSWSDMVKPLIPVYARLATAGGRPQLAARRTTDGVKATPEPADRVAL